MPTIEHGIEKQKRENKTGVRHLLPTVLKMKVGDSFLTEKTRRGNMATLAFAAKVDISTSSIGQPEGMIRVWRTA